MKRNINLYGADWDMATSQQHCDKLKYINWVYDNSSNISVYINSSIQLAPSHDPSTKKYAWINESKAIDPYAYQLLNDNRDLYISVFDKILTHDKSVYTSFENAFFNPLSVVWIKDMAVHPKTRLVSMISSSKAMCEGHRIRLQWVEKLAPYLDLYGSTFRYIQNKETGLNDYMFSVAIENATYESCFTEKILDCFATGTIPIYLGPKDIGDFFNKDGIIILDEGFDINSLTPELYYSKMDAIRENFELCKKYLFVEDYMYENYIKGNNE